MRYVNLFYFHYTFNWTLIARSTCDSYTISLMLPNFLSNIVLFNNIICFAKTRLGLIRPHLLMSICVGRRCFRNLLASGIIVITGLCSFALSFEMIN